jgi:tRNA-Thr(GGU) m(6)t(6)A37 methyltransferase TsaA
VEADWGSVTSDAHGLRPIGRVRSALRALADAPRQADEGAPEAWLEVDAAFAAGLRGLEAGQEILVLTWFHEARRDILELHPRGDRERPLTGVFATRSPDRPNPIGLHRVRIVEVADRGLRVDAIEAIDGTPVIDVKPVLSSVADR